MSADSAKPWPNNPAARLHSILVATKRAKPEHKVREIWAAMYDIDAEDTASVLLVVADLILLVRDAKQALARLEGDTELYLRPFLKIERAFASANLEVPWKQFQAQIDDSTLVGIEYGAEALSQIQPEIMASDEQLQSLLRQVDELLDEVIASDLPQQLKTIIIEKLQAIRHAASTYSISGVQGLLSALESSVGSWFLFKSAFSESLESPVVQRWMQLMRALNQIVSLALNAPGVLSSVADILKLPPGRSDES